MTNPLQQLGGVGQAVWLDYIDRRILETGGLKRLIEQDGLKGVTSNPSIFEKAIGETSDYDARLQSFLAKGEASAVEAYEFRAISDIQEAADQLRPVYNAAGGAA